jgi:hypothetical protein
MTSDFSVSGSFTAKYSDLCMENKIITPIKKLKLITNAQDCVIGVFLLDSKAGRKVVFKRSTEIPNVSKSKLIVKIGGFSHTPQMTDKIIEEANKLLNGWREETMSFFMTPVLDFTSSGEYRRRLSIKDAKKILSKSIENLSSPIPMYFNL